MAETDGQPPETRIIYVPFEGAIVVMKELPGGEATPYESTTPSS